MLAFGLFSLGNSSDSFLILRSRDLGLSLTQIILAFTLNNLVYAALATPMGKLSDRVPRKWLIGGGWCVYAGVYLAFAAVNGSGAPWLLFAFYGLYQAMAEGASKALVGDLVSKEQRAGAIGLLYTVGGIGQLLASLLAGATWNLQFPGGWHVPFVLGGFFALLAVPIVLRGMGSTRRQRTAAGVL